MTPVVHCSCFAVQLGVDDPEESSSSSDAATMTVRSTATGSSRQTAKRAKKRKQADAAPTTDSEDPSMKKLVAILEGMATTLHTILERVPPPLQNSRQGAGASNLP